jgi:FAD:protein FMN transferase
MLKPFSRTLKLMGNRFVITIVERDYEKACFYIDMAIAEIKRIEKLLTTFSDESQTFHINQQAGVAPVKVDSEVFNLISRAQKISTLTDGAFDLSYGSMDRRFWNFDKTMDKLPDPEVARQTVEMINYKNIVLDSANLTVFLKRKGMRIGFGGIGKGYAADAAKQILKQNGAESGIINASGDLITWGTQPNGSPWTIALANPDYVNEAFSELNVSNMAVATSGNYEKYVIIDGKKYSHTINPQTGYPVTGIKSVTIICPMAELADAMATPVTVLGVDKGLGLVNQIKGMSCVIIDDNNQLFASKNINIT